jgi:hypothetical protein
MHKVQLKNYGENGLLLKVKKMRHLITIILFTQVLGVSTLQAQQFQINTIAATGYENYKSNNLRGVISSDEKIIPFFLFGATGQYFFHEKPFFAELGANLNHSIRQYTLEEYANFGYTVLDARRIERHRHTTYLGIPFSLGINKEKFAIKVGVQLLVNLNVSDFSSAVAFASSDAEVPTEAVKEFIDFPSNNLEKFIQIDLKFWGKFTLQLSASHNSDSKLIDHIFPSHRFGIGISYMMYKSNP